MQPYERCARLTPCCHLLRRPAGGGSGKGINLNALRGHVGVGLEAEESEREKERESERAMLSGGIPSLLLEKACMYTRASVM